MLHAFLLSGVFMTACDAVTELELNMKLFNRYMKSVANEISGGAASPSSHELYSQLKALDGSEIEALLRHIRDGLGEKTKLEFYFGNFSFERLIKIYFSKLYNVLVFPHSSFWHINSFLKELRNEDLNKLFYGEGELASDRSFRSKFHKYMRAIRDNESIKIKSFLQEINQEKNRNAIAFFTTLLEQVGEPLRSHVIGTGFISFGDFLTEGLVNLFDPFCKDFFPDEESFANIANFILNFANDEDKPLLMNIFFGGEDVRDQSSHIERSKKLFHMYMRALRVENNERNRGILTDTPRQSTVLAGELTSLPSRDKISLLNRILEDLGEMKHTIYNILTLSFRNFFQLFIRNERLPSHVQFVNIVSFLRKNPDVADASCRRAFYGQDGLVDPNPLLSKFHVYMNQIKDYGNNEYAQDLYGGIELDWLMQAEQRDYGTFLQSILINLGESSEIECSYDLITFGDTLEEKIRTHGQYFADSVNDAPVISKFDCLRIIRYIENTKVEPDTSAFCDRGVLRHVFFGDRSSIIDRT